MKINKKKMFIVSIVFMVIIVVIILWSYFNGEKEVINNIEEIIPSEEITDEQLRNTSVALYYINKDNGEIEVENKNIDSKKLLNNTYVEILKLWFEGTKKEKLITGCSNNVKINNIKIINNCAIVDLSEEFIKEKNNKELNELRIIYCIVNTLTELNEINSVKILINGKENIYFGNINLSEEYFRLNE